MPTAVENQGGMGEKKNNLTGPSSLMSLNFTKNSKGLNFVPAVQKGQGQQGQQLPGGQQGQQSNG